MNSRPPIPTVFWELPVSFFSIILNPCLHLSSLSSPQSCSFYVSNSVHGIGSLRPSCLRTWTSDSPLNLTFPALPSSIQWLTSVASPLKSPNPIPVSDILHFTLTAPFNLLPVISSWIFLWYPMLTSIMVPFTLQYNLFYLLIPTSQHTRGAQQALIE